MLKIGQELILSSLCHRADCQLMNGREVTQEVRRGVKNSGREARNQHAIGLKAENLGVRGQSPRPSVGNGTYF
jgi:hypothetical protein